MRRWLLLCALAAGCLGNPFSSSQTTPPTDDAGAADSSDMGVADQAVGPPDLTPPADLFPADLEGLVNCDNKSFCDPTMDFCIRFHDGSQGTPGNLTAGPACFKPTDDCATQGQAMDCGCIQGDPTLGVSCQGSCVDRGGGIFDCYAQP